MVEVAGFAPTRDFCAMRFRRNALITLGLAAATTLVGCPSDDDLTSPFAPMDLTITVNPAQVQIPISDTITASNSTLLALSATSLGFPVIAPHARWTTSDPRVALVDSGGRVQALTVGTSTIQARVNGETSTSVVSVVRAVTGATILPSAVLGTVGDTTTLTATAVGTNGLLVGGTIYTFVTTDPSVVVLSRNGNRTVLLTFLKVGTAKVSVIAGGQTAFTNVTVH
jgi:hypothetical protein